jgi:probable addiction module antidote protein
MSRSEAGAYLRREWALTYRTICHQHACFLQAFDGEELWPNDFECRQVGGAVILLALEERHQTRQRTRGTAGLTGKAMMTKRRIKVNDLPEFDATPYLDSEEAVAAYLTDILEANDAGLLAAALGDIARARGMTEIAKTAGITREALYKALRPGSEPRFDTVNRVCAALGVRLVAQAVHTT